MITMLQVTIKKLKMRGMSNDEIKAFIKEKYRRDISDSVISYNLARANEYLYKIDNVGKINSYTTIPLTSV